MKMLSRVLAPIVVGLAGVFPVAAQATLVTWEMGGTLEDTSGLGVSAGDAFTVRVTFDTEAALLATQTGGRFDPGARYVYDPSAVTFDISLGGGATNLSFGAGGFDAFLLRDNTGDVAASGEPPVVDSISFNLGDNATFLTQVIFRGSILDIYEGGALPATPDPRLLELELSQFNVNTLNGFGTGRITALRAVPAPGGIALLGLGLFGLGLLRRRR